jgi:membrane-bound lytic murein transglycosylase B
MAKVLPAEEVAAFVQNVVKSLSEYGMTTHQITDVFHIIQGKMDVYHHDNKQKQLKEQWASILKKD